jgi:signal transduction histidine kinase/CheY-like chemotaxis protein
MDQHDYVWLGTWDGLNQYDGSNIIVHKPDPFLKGTISNNVIRNLLEDGEGNLWIVTHLGINKYIRNTNSFQIYLNSPTDIPFQEYNLRACIGADSSLFISLIGRGISRYSFSEDRFVPVEYEGIDNKWLTSIIDLGYYRDLEYLLGSDGRLSCTVNNRLVYSKQIAGKNNFSFHKFILMNGHYYLAIVNDQQKLLLYALDNIEKDPYTVELGDIYISTLATNLDHTALWLGSESGDIMKIEWSGDGLVPTLMNSFFPGFSKARIKILSIQETKQDIVWIGTDGDGVYKFLTRPKTFYSISEGPPESGQLSHSIIRSIYEDHAGNLYIGTRGGGLNIIEAKTGKTAIRSTKNGLSNDAVLSINQDHNQNIWLGLDGEGIDMIEAGSQKVFHFPRDFENRNDISFGAVYSICIDAFNDIWLGTSGYGVIQLKVTKSPNGRYTLAEYDQLVHPGKDGQLSLNSNIVYTIVEEKPNLLWFGTRGGGIYRYNALTKEIEAHIQTDADGKSSLSNNDVLSLHIDQQEQLWIGSSGGLDRLYLPNKPYRIEHFTQREGLPNNTIHGILEDSNSNIWLSTNLGLVMYDRGKKSFKTFDANDGLNNNEFADGAAFQSSITSKLFFGGIDGLDIVYPLKLHIQDYFPRLTLTELQLRNSTVIPGDQSNILTRPIDATDTITLTYDQNFVSFFFTTMDYWNKQKSEYRYLLENFDNEWNFIGTQQSITFTNIQPGDYTLKINFTNENGDWAETPKTISITVTPPFYKTSWAYAGYVMLAIGMQLGIILYIRWRTRAKKAVAMGNFRAQQLKELNDYKLQFFTNIAHEFRTPLTLILGPAAYLLKKGATEVEQKQLKTIYSNSLRLQKLIDELILFRKIESGKDRLSLSTIDLVNFTQNVVESFKQHATDREVNLEFHPEPDTLTAFVDTKKLEKVLINLLSNAIKYNAPGGMVTISLQESLGKASFTIHDEGIGIAHENLGKIFESFYQNPKEIADTNGIEKSTGIGLSLTKSLVQIHRGEIHVASTLGKGSTFSITIPIAKNYYADIPIESPVISSSLYLPEKVSLEFETDHYLSGNGQKGKVTRQDSHEYALLIVDDHTSIISLLDNILSDKYVIHKARNGNKALEILETEKIDLVISDVLMPDMDGLTLCKKIKDNIYSSHIPVILLTAKGEIEDRIDGLQMGADSYIPKPFHPDHLFVRIEKLIERMEMVRKQFLNMGYENPSNLGMGEKDDKFFSRITECINQHLGETEFNAETMADEVGMSKASLYKKVKSVTGLTPHGLIKQYRLKKAADLLRNSSLSVSEVIYETGFNSRSYFYKSFNELFHCHPKEFERASSK